MDPMRALLLANGVARYKDLVTAGVPLNRIRDQVAAGRILRPHRGVYALPTADPIDVAAALFRAEPCCISVLARAGIPVVPRAAKPHLALPDDRSLGRPGLRDLDAAVFHWCDRYTREAMRRVPVAIDVASRCLELPGLLAAADAALRAGKMSRAQIRAFRTAPVATRAWLAKHADARSESPLESVTRAALIEGGFNFDLQVQILGVGRVDFVVERRLVIECDGFAFHSDKESHAEDLRRGRALTTQSIPHLRYVWDDVWKSSDEIIADVRAVLWRLGCA
ncbi:type IV toxin-antitoxin system AbiEi family antitoxin domain-containing protein [Demequina iriomotensis]|uniref:type IV toxin-antitoxin system AbiEi family antitoxin domain-containing protein n=1 Tax=Demequina iriomotensis TaxID=1536641 RepID=UPI0007844CD4|nr:type IV toxin-antitoxin system AbiEi family antitoxin domain-containing protein [Demequina iriomotensis]